MDPETCTLNPQPSTLNLQPKPWILKCVPFVHRMDLTLESGESRGEHILPKGARTESRVLEDEEEKGEEEEGRVEIEDVAVEFQTDSQPPGPVRDPDARRDRS